MENNQVPSGASENTVSDSTQTEVQTQTQASSDTVAYASHKRLLGEKKKLQVEHDDAMKELTQMRESSLQADGKKDELIESYKKRITDMESKVTDFAYSSVSAAVRAKALEMGCVVGDKVVNLLDINTLSLGDGFSVDSDEVNTMLEIFKKENPQLFKAKNPNVSNDVPNKNFDPGTGKPDFSKMTVPEMKEWAAKNNIK